MKKKKKQDKTIPIKKRLTLKQKKFIKCFSGSMGNIHASCEEAEVSRATYYRWLSESEAFKEEIENVTEMNVDYAESKLMSVIQEKNVTAIIFYLKTKGKSRGYVEQNEVKIEANPFMQLLENLPDEENK